MRVILLVNLDITASLVNGSQGLVIGFEQYDPNKVQVPVPPSPKKSRNREGPAAQFSEHAALRNEQIHCFMEAAPVKEWPTVEFINGRTQTIYANCQFNQYGMEEPYSLLGRTQIPPLASWAITCHKSQGMTLSRVIVYLHNSFERGMVYVALSRARNMEGLKFLRLPKSLDMPGNEGLQEFLKEKFGKLGATRGRED